MSYTNNIGATLALSAMMNANMANQQAHHVSALEAPTQQDTIDNAPGDTQVQAPMPLPTPSHEVTSAITLSAPRTYPDEKLADGILVVLCVIFLICVFSIIILSVRRK